MLLHVLGENAQVAIQVRWEMGELLRALGEVSTVLDQGMHPDARKPCTNYFEDPTLTKQTANSTRVHSSDLQQPANLSNVRSASKLCLILPSSCRAAMSSASRALISCAGLRGATENRRDVVSAEET